MSGEISSLFSDYPPSVRPRRPPEPLGNAGGLSGASLWRYDSPIGRLVARAWPAEGPNEEQLVRIHSWMGSLRDLRFAPIPISGLDGRTFRRLSGRFWEIAPWMPGVADRDRPPRSDRVRAGFEALAMVHSRLAGHATSGQSPGLSARLREIEELRLGGFDLLERAVVAASPSPLREHSLRWIATARGLADRVLGEVRSAAIRSVRLQPSLRDVRPDHLLFEDDRLTGLVDFGAMAIESVSADLARLLAEWLGGDDNARSAALAAYSAIHPLSEAEIALIPAFEASSSLLIGGHWTRWRFVEHRRFDDPSAALDGLRRGLERLDSLAVGTHRFGSSHGAGTI